MEEVKKPVCEPGLGLRSIRELNRALYGKWLCRSLVEDERLWRKVMHVRWGDWEKERGRRGRFKPHGMSLWKKIRDDSYSFKGCVGWQLGTDPISFWQDEWMGNFKLKDRFTRIFDIACDKEAKVKEMYENVGEGKAWNVKVKRNLRDWEINDYSNLLLCLDSMKLNDDRDKRVWKLDEIEGFSVKAMYKSLCMSDNSGSKTAPFKQIWNTRAPPRMAFLTWETANVF